MDGLMDILAGTTSEVFYLFLLALFTFIATLALPLPVEAALFLGPETNVFFQAIALGLGKAAAAVVALRLGKDVNQIMQGRLMSTGLAKAFVNFCNYLVVKFHYAGLYFILSVPLMVDTVPVYLFGIFNDEGTIRAVPFAYVNFLAAVNRVIITMIAFSIWGVELT